MVLMMSSAGKIPISSDLTLPSSLEILTLSPVLVTRTLVPAQAKEPVPLTVVVSRMSITLELSLPLRSVAYSEPCLRPCPKGMLMVSGGTAGLG